MTIRTTPQHMTEIDATDDLISERIREIQRHLASVVSIRIRHPINDYLSLVFGKIDGVWQFSVEQEGQSTPLLSLSRETRAEAHSWIAALIACIPSHLENARRERLKHLERYDALVLSLS